MQSGLLSGAFSAARIKRLASDDWRRTAPEFRAPRLARNLALAHALRPIARRHGVKVGAVAVAWVTSWPGVTAAIVGARSPRQVDDWIEAATLKLSADDMAELATAVRDTETGEGPACPQDVEAWQWEVGVQE
jgi:aryl-alcohol dehydrogenase-like predicted oxidoreductase